MEKYLLSLDLDGTLLNRRGKIPFLTKLGIKSLLKQGHYVILNSGRPYQGMLKIIKTLKLYNYPFIASNGGGIFYINRKEEIVKSQTFGMKYELVNKFFKEIKPYLTYAYLQGVYSTFYYRYDILPPYMKYHHSNLKDFQIDDFNLEVDILNGYFAIRKESVEIVKKIFEKKRYSALNFLCWGEDKGNICFDIQSSLTNKGLALTKLVNQLKVKHENTLAFGDSKNDISMLESVYKGFLVPSDLNMSDKLPFVCITKDSNHNGVMRYIFKNFKNLF